MSAAVDCELSLREEVVVLVDCASRVADTDGVAGDDRVGDAESATCNSDS